MFKDLQSLYTFPTEKPSLDVVIKGWGTWADQFRNLLTPTTAPYILVEVGCWFGKNTIEWLSTFENAKVIVIDTFNGGVEHQPGAPFYEKELYYLYDQFITNVWKFKDRVIPIKAYSYEGLQIIYNFQIKPDLIYIDASHLYLDVLKDIETAFKLFPDSIIVGDDYGHLNSNDVKKAVDFYVKSHDYTLERYNRFWHILNK